MLRGRIIVGTILTLGAGAWGPHAALAAPRRSKREAPVAAEAAPPKPVSLPPERLALHEADLFGEDDNKATAAAKTLGDSGAPNAAEPLIAVLAAGTTPWVATTALEALGKLKDPRAIQVLVLYAGNRNLKTRLAAVRALGALPDGRVVGTLLERLGDPEPEVRTVAAESLAARKESRAVERLFKLVARNDAGAAGPLGVLAPADLSPKIAELRGQVDDAILATTFGELIKRADIPDRLRLDVVRTIGGLPGAAATTALVEYLASVPDSENRPSKDEAQRLIDQRGTNP